MGRLVIMKPVRSHWVKFCVCCQTSATPVEKPSVTVYQAASSDHLEEKRSLLCVASQMVPPVVKITWKSQKQDGSPLAASPGDTEQLDVIESDYTASILLIHQQDENSHTYGCSVTHEGGTVEGQIEEGNENLLPFQHEISYAATQMWLFCFRSFSKSTKRTSTRYTFHQSNFNRMSIIRTSRISKTSKTALPGVHGADHKESGVLLWSLSAQAHQTQPQTCSWLTVSFFLAYRFLYRLSLRI